MYIKQFHYFNAMFNVSNNFWLWLDYTDVLKKSQSKENSLIVKDDWHKNKSMFPFCN